jgi:putative flippase GtrA
LALVRYTLIGAIATAVHYVVLVALVEGLNVSPSPSAMLGATCGALVAYIGNREFTFASSALHRIALPRFLVIAAIGAVLSGGMVWIGTVILAWYYLVAQLLATILIVFLTYQLNRLWTFR